MGNYNKIGDLYFRRLSAEFGQAANSGVVGGFEPICEEEYAALQTEESGMTFAWIGMEKALYRLNLD